MEYIDAQFIDAPLCCVVCQQVVLSSADECPGCGCVMTTPINPDNRLPIPDVVGYIRHVADILAVIHTLAPAPMVHGDIKPSNLIRRPDGRLVLIDLGVAQAHGQIPPYVRAPASAFGTPGYTPPEQWEGHPTPASDIFALGATMHQLLTGRDPTARFARLAEVSFADLKAPGDLPGAHQPRTRRARAAGNAAHADAPAPGGRSAHSGRSAGPSNADEISALLPGHCCGDGARVIPTADDRGGDTRVVRPPAHAIHLCCFC